MIRHIIDVYGRSVVIKPERPPKPTPKPKLTSKSKPKPHGKGGDDK